MSIIKKKKIISFVELIHLRIFGHEMSGEMRTFLGNLSWSFFGGVIASGLLFVATVIAGRVLGPEEFGRYNLVIIIGQFILIPMLLGMDITLARFLSKTNDEIEKKKEISTAISVIILSVVCVLSVLFLFRNILTLYINVDKNIFLLSLIFAFVFAYKMLGDGFVRGLHKFKYQANVKVFEGSLILIAMLLMFFVHRTYVSVVFATFLGAFFSTIFFLFCVRKYVDFRFFDIKKLKEIFGYAKYVIAGLVVGVIFAFGDKFLINKYLGVEELGVYMAYYTISIMVFGQLATIFNNVFFPSISKVKEKIYIMHKIDKMILVGFVPMFLGMSVFIYLTMIFFGKDYPVNILFMMLFALLGVTQFFTQLYASVVNVHSQQTYFWGISFMIMRTIGFVIYVILFVYIGMFDIYTLLLGYIANYIIDIFNLRFIIKKYAK